MRFSLGTECGGNLGRFLVNLPNHLQVLGLHQILYCAWIARIPDFRRALGFSRKQHSSVAEYLSCNTKGGRSQELGLHVQLSPEDHEVVVQSGHGRDRSALTLLAVYAAAFPLVIIHDSAIFIDER